MFQVEHYGARVGICLPCDLADAVVGRDGGCGCNKARTGADATPVPATATPIFGMSRMNFVMLALVVAGLGAFAIYTKYPELGRESF